MAGAGCVDVDYVGQRFEPPPEEQDIRLFGLGCEKDGRLKFLRRHEVGGAASGREGA